MEVAHLQFTNCCNFVSVFVPLKIPISQTTGFKFEICFIFWPEAAHYIIVGEKISNLRHHYVRNVSKMRVVFFSYNAKSKAHKAF